MKPNKKQVLNPFTGNLVAPSSLAKYIRDSKEVVDPTTGEKVKKKNLGFA